MKNINTSYILKLLFNIILFCVILSCSNRSTNSNTYSNVKKIEIPDKIDEPLPWDSLIDDIKIVPLETNNNCLIGEVCRISNLNEKFYIQDKHNKVLFIFDEKGKFLFKIAKNGKGNGEYLELRDFKVDLVGNIYILDYQKIIKYSSAGEYLASIPLDKYQNIEKYDYLNPLEFALGKDGDFYLYNGSMGILKSLKNQFAVYKINSKGKLTGRYIPIKRQLFQSEGFFYETRTGYNIQPILGNDTIYSINEGRFEKNYYVDYGKRKLSDEVLPVKQSGLGEYILKLGNSSDYCMGIRKIIETEDAIAFNFWNKGVLHYVLNSKKSNKQYVGKQYSCKTIRPSNFACTYKEYLISVMETNILKGMCNEISPNDYKKMSGMDKSIIDQVKNMDNMNNPALLFIKLKKF